MEISELFAKIDEALFARSPLWTIRGLLFSLQRRVLLEKNLCTLKEVPDKDILDDENDRLRSKLAEAYDTIERLKFEAHGRSRGCSEAQHDILKCISFLGPHTEQELAESLNLSLGAVHLYLCELQDIAYLGVNTEFRWRILEHGLRYLDKCGCLSGLDAFA